MSIALLDAPAFTQLSVHGLEQYILEHLAEQAVIDLNTVG
jgi:hypothetical protein